MGGGSTMGRGAGRVGMVVLVVLAALVAVAVAPDRGHAVLQERTLSSGVADSSGVAGARWRRVNFSALATGSATFRLSWTGTATLHFQVFNAAGTRIGGNTATAGSPKTAAVTLASGAAYSATIWSSSGVGTFQLTLTENVPDGTPPTSPANLRAGPITAGSVALIWDSATDDDQVARYDVYRGAALAGSATGLSFTDTGLQPATAYSYTVRAVDRTGNTSAPSAPLAVVTLDDGPPDSSPPTVPGNLRVTATGGTSVSVAWDAATDARGVAGYRVSVDGTPVGVVTGLAFTIGSLERSTTYAVGVTAFDAAGNESAPAGPVTATTTDRAPNIIVIETDDQRTDTLRDMPKTRQWLVDGGTSFPNGYVSTPSCCPSRATLMSGRYVHNNQQFTQQVLGFDLNLTVQRWLHDGGYFTGHSGKFLHWLTLAEVAPHWDRWTHFKANYVDVYMRLDTVTRRTTGYSTTITFDRALEYLDDFEARDDDRPFFLQLTPVAPHSPSTPEAQYANAAVSPFVTTPAHTETDRSDKPSFVRNRNTSLTSAQNTRTAMIRTLYTVDDQVDRLMRRLDALGELDDTLVIYTSDNGYFDGEHGLNSKFLPYTESVRVPFLVRWPGHVAAGAVDDRRVTHVDITPTILAAAGITQDDVALDGHDILSGHDRELAFTEYYQDSNNMPGIPTWAAIETDTYLYVEYYSTSRDRTTPTFREYYDTVADPFLLQNLLGDASTANDPNVAALSATLAGVKDCSAAACP